MPSTPFDTMLAATLDNRRQEIYDQVIESHPFTAWLKAGGKVKPWEGGGENIEFNVSIDLSDRFAARDYKTKLEFKEQDPIRVLELGRRFINGSVIWYEAQEEANKGKYKIFDFVNTLVENAKASASDVWSLEMWQDGSGEHIHGLPAIVDSDNTYAGINRATAGNEWWKAKEGAQFTQTLPNGQSRTYGPYNTAEAFVLSGGTDGGLLKIYNDCCLNGGTDGPDFAITSEALWNKLWNLIGAERVRYNEKMVELGYPENIQFRGMTIVWDRNCGAVAGTPDDTTMYLLNTKYMELKPYVEYSTGFKATETFDLHSEGLFAKGKLMQWCGNLLSTKPQRMGRLTGKTV